jgi:GNAT superfamily N-acetyltransferase
MKTSALSTVPVQAPAQRRAVIQFPFDLYRGDPHWVPPLRAEQRRFLDPRHNPFYQHADVALWLACRGREVRGTISAQVDHLHNAIHGERTGFFGFFEVVDDYAVAAALLETAREWLRQQGMETMRGPLSFSRSQGCGLLLEGEPGLPALLTAYNPLYYAGFCERFGLRKAQDAYAYLLDLTQFATLHPGDPLPPLVQLATAVGLRTQARLRHVTRDDYDALMEQAKEVYHRSFAERYDFMPMTDAEFAHFAAGLRRVLDPDLAVGAEVEGELVGIAIALPDANQVLLHLGGRLFPTGWLKALWLRRNRAITRARLMILGVLPQYRRQGIEALLLSELFRRAVGKGFREVEFSWVLESNTAMNQLIAYWGRAYGVRRYRTYRLYEMPIAGGAAQRGEVAG